MPLSDAKIRSIKPSGKPFKLTDSQGLYLLVVNYSCNNFRESQSILRI